MSINSAKTGSIKFEKILKKFKCAKGQPFTHTRIGDPSLGVLPGAYFIPNDEYTNFYKLYVEHVFANNKQEYLTEKQPENGPLLIDIDFRYNPEVEKRMHNNEDIINLIDIVLKQFEKIYKLNNEKNINIYIFEKEEPNFLEEVTKDGIHIMTNIIMDNTSKILIRNMLIEELPKIWNHIPIINTWSDVLDIGVIKGDVNWQLVGSRKPGHQQYQLINQFNLTYINTSNGWNFKEIGNDFNYKENFYNLSCRTMETVKFDFNPDIKPQYDNIFNLNKNKSFAKKIQRKRNVKNIEDIESMDDLDNLIEIMLNECDKFITDIHHYTMILPETYYQPGTYYNWIRVGWALKNSDEKLLLTWIKFSSQSSDFDFTDVGDLIDKWDTFKTYNSDGITKKSILYWAKQSNLEKYNEVRMKSIDYYIEQAQYNNMEYDMAKLLYELYKDQFICASIKDNVWYEFIDHRWNIIDSGNTLRLKLSTELHDLFRNKIKDIEKQIYSVKNNEQLIQNATNISNEIVDGDLKKKNENPVVAKLMKKRDTFMEISSKKLKSTAWKNNIMKEAKELFYDKSFIHKMDQNKYLLCFNNCVVDFKENTVRNGKPDDYITKSTNINYIKDEELTSDRSKKKYNNIKLEIYDFMKQLFPNDNLRQYMWEHLASTLMGTNENQTFNIYNGSGANGKSKLVELMGFILGEYKGTVPISLVTQKRNGIGGTSSEVAQLIGVRYAVMQEPSKGDQINEGIMKELTGGDPIQCRQLFRESQTFTPQFKLVVCTNTLFEINSQDDGTWRRLRLVEFASKFTNKPNTCENPDNNSRFPLENYPHQFEIDPHLDEKFSEWGPIFMKELVKIAMETKGKVKDCNEVTNKTDEYRRDKDVLSEFANENIIHEQGASISKTNLRESFKNWYEDKYDKKGMPNGKELYQWMDNKYGKCGKNNKWKNIILISNINIE